MREVGNRLLLDHGDSTSRVLPVIAKDQRTYELSFEPPLSFSPDRLVFFVSEAFQKAELPDNYITEVIQCSDDEVAYSYQMTSSEERTIVPCAQRELPEACYTIQLGFSEMKAAVFDSKWLLYLFSLVAFVFLVDVIVQQQKGSKRQRTGADTVKLGIFNFYPQQNKLVKDAAEINLSRKECELLEIFVANPNMVIKRDELTKRVWEEKGVIVGRSLDTYISKLRKKLREDDSIKLTNIHGVGYKLELT